ncbi:MAG: hypothetical protein M1829_001019 [Trizodia sp. TS-e1964]|nr:MAG: hypothetical protein M1829_001019 [Trizodia sp. TS-e1964]
MAPEIGKLRIPIVTESDLKQFFLDHFSSNASQLSTLQAIPSQSILEDNENEYDDALGYYSDGTKRTLTDQQIAIFRHTEIYQLLQKKRQCEGGSKNNTEFFENNKRFNNDMQTPSAKRRKSSSSSERNQVSDDLENEEYELFLKKEAEAFELERRRINLNAHDIFDNKEELLDYEDNEPSSQPAGKPSREPGKFQRKQVSYADQCMDGTEDTPGVIAGGIGTEHGTRTFLWPKIGG